MSVPYEIPPFRFAAPGGQTTCVVIPFPSRTLIAKLVIQQINAPGVNFTAELFNHASVCEGDSISDSVGPDEGLGLLPPNVFKVGPTFNGVAGYLEYFADEATGGFGLLFFNQDKRDETQVVRPKHINKIYLRITPAGSVENEFALGMAGMHFE